jgi:3',5'-cyclic AMP phosphodiesterase CpdA
MSRSSSNPILKTLLILIFPLFFLSCKDLFLYSPDEVRLNENERDLNIKNIQKIKSQPSLDSFSFIVVGDSQRFYDELDDFVNVVNNLPEISFVVQVGDISDFGLNKEFRWINKRLQKLKAPYITVIGNHDMLANGRLVYNQMFGAEDFTFDHNNSRFIFLNTNSQEVGFNGSLPNLQWLQQQISSGNNMKNIFIFSHVAPFSSAFDKALEQPFTNLLANHNNVRLSIHGHEHQYIYGNPYPGHVPYLVIASMNKRNYAVITVAGTNYQVKEMQY